MRTAGWRWRWAGAVLAAWASVLGANGEPAMILVKPTVAWNVTGGDDVGRLKQLASGVGWEFEPNAEAEAALKRVGMRAIRCINVDPLPGQFDAAGAFTVGQPDRLLAHLATCRRVGARPHIIIAQGVHPDLRLTVDDVKDQPALMGLVPSGTFGPRDWGRFRTYCQAYFEYVVITQGFGDAEFEVANEPDIGGAVHTRPPKPANGSRALYEGYFELYRNVALAAAEFERTHAGAKVRLGGPALAWAFTFRYGDFNWAERFLRDCGEAKLKLDYVGLHFYGNIASLDGQYAANFPSFQEMLKATAGWRDRYCPGVPIWLTEWGPSYHTTNEPQSAVNANSTGAAWSAAFLDAMLTGGVESALYLVTTDLRQPVKGQEGKYENVWGWPSLFVNPQIFGRAYPKAPFHVFEMVTRLAGSRVEATRGPGTLACMASADAQAKRLTVLVWNYGARIPEFGPPVEGAQREALVLRVREAGAFFGTARVRVRRWLVADGYGDAHGRFARGEALDEANTALQETDGGVFAVADGQADIGFSAPPSSVSLVEVVAE